jgi:hypothetical protein
VTEITLRNRKKEVVGVAFVDDSDAELVKGHTWCLMRNGYAATRSNKRLVYLHRLLMGEPKKQVDHRDRNKLNCQRLNLRTGSDANNKENVPGRENRTSRFRGVFFESKSGRWLTSFANRAGSRKRFDSEEKAAAFVEHWRLRNLSFAEPELR